MSYTDIDLREEPGLTHEGIPEDLREHFCLHEKFRGGGDWLLIRCKTCGFPLGSCNIRSLVGCMREHGQEHADFERLQQ